MFADWVTGTPGSSGETQFVTVRLENGHNSPYETPRL